MSEAINFNRGTGANDQNMFNNTGFSKEPADFNAANQDALNFMRGSSAVEPRTTQNR